MSPVFRTPLGWHLLVLTERNDGKFESYRLQITRALVSEKAAKAGKDLKKYLQTLAERYKVTYLEDGYRDSTVAGVYEP
jgi:parvulin-like peptidyl-prolyl isomerase